MKASFLRLAILPRQLGLLFVLLISVIFSMPAMAQNHGVGVGKSCPNATKVGDLAGCVLAVTNRDEWGDSLTVNDFWDVIDPAGVAMRNPAVGNLPIVAVDAGVTCVPAAVSPAAPIGLTFPCVIPGEAVTGGSDLGLVVESIYTVPIGSADPLLDQGNVVTTDGCELGTGCNPNPQQQQFGAAVSLFEPSIAVTKTGPAQAKVGDEITYTIGFTDTTTGTGFPGFENCTGNDPLLGGDLGVFTAGVTRDFPYTVQVGDADPLLNTATITCGVVGFDNVIENSDTHSVDLIDPSVALAKACAPNPVSLGETIDWQITVTNTGDVDLDCLVNDPIAGIVDGAVTVAAGGSQVLNASRTVQAGDAPAISNTATVSCPVPGFNNVVTDEATAVCDVLLVDKGIPTLSDWALWLLVLTMLGVGLLLINRNYIRLRK
ncbi:MAG: hypothetical protein WBS20_11760 [Lysobacterales bacterium]